jgi:hypothetical protein
MQSRLEKPGSLSTASALRLACPAWTGSDDVAAVVAAALRTRPWECGVIGGGVRNEDQLELFEQVLNLVRRRAPDAAIALSSTPADTFDATARWIDIPGLASGRDPHGS